MLSDELKSIREVLGGIMGKVPVEMADVLRIARRNLDAAADQAEQLEQGLLVPEQQTTREAA